MHFENVEPCPFVRRWNDEQLVEPSGAQERRVENVRAVGRGYYYDVFHVLDAVHLGEQRVDHAFGDVRFSFPAAPRSRYRINLVEENDCGRCRPGFPEYLAQSLFAFSHPLAYEFGTADCDEIGFAFRCDRFCKQGFSRAGRAEQQDSAHRAYSQARESFGLFERKFDSLFQFFLDFLQAAYLLPFDVRHFDVHFPQRGGAHFAQGVVEICFLDPDFLQDFLGDFLVLQIDFRQHAAQRFHRRFLNQALQISADEAVRLRSQFVEGNVFLQGHSTSVDLQDFLSSLFVGRAYFYLAVEPPWPAQRRVERVRAVGGADDYHLPS